MSNPCSNCDEPLEINWEFCPACNHPNERYQCLCPQCDAYIQKHWQMCPYCKYKLAEQHVELSVESSVTLKKSISLKSKQNSGDDLILQCNLCYGFGLVFFPPPPFNRSMISHSFCRSCHGTGEINFSSLYFPDKNHWLSIGGYECSACNGIGLLYDQGLLKRTTKCSECDGIGYKPGEEQLKTGIYMYLRPEKYRQFKSIDFSKYKIFK